MAQHTLLAEDVQGHQSPEAGALRGSPAEFKKLCFNIRDTRARNIPALLLGVRVSLQSWQWEKSPFLFKARYKNTFVSCVTFQRKKKVLLKPLCLWWTGVSCVPAVKCPKVTPVWVWQCHSQAPLPIYKFGHFLSPWYMAELRTNGGSIIRSKYEFLMVMTTLFQIMKEFG